MKAYRVRIVTNTEDLAYIASEKPESRTWLDGERWLLIKLVSGSEVYVSLPCILRIEVSLTEL